MPDRARQAEVGNTCFSSEETRIFVYENTIRTNVCGNAYGPYPTYITMYDGDFVDVRKSVSETLELNGAISGIYAITPIQEFTAHQSDTVRTRVFLQESCSCAMDHPRRDEAHYRTQVGAKSHEGENVFMLGPCPGLVLSIQPLVEVSLTSDRTVATGVLCDACDV
jgi:hypothetical protein